MASRQIAALETVAVSTLRYRLVVTGVLVFVALSPFQPFAWTSASDDRLAPEQPMMTMSKAVARQEAVVFGVYPEAGNGEVGNVTSPGHALVLDAIDELRVNQPFDVHLYTAWSWHNTGELDAKINSYTSAGLTITLTIKYSPPPGHNGDVKGYTKFVQTVVRRYGANPAVKRYVIGNEANVTWGDPGSSDGPFKDASRAVVEGVVAAHQQLKKMPSSAEVGTSIAITDSAQDSAFLRNATKRGGLSFIQAVSFIGINVYPGLWPVGTNDPYADMATHLRTTRAAISNAGLKPSVSIAVLENGFPTADDAEQAARLTPMVKAVCDLASEVGVSSYSWFGLVDANSGSDNRFAHFGLLRSDLSQRPSFDRYRELIAAACAT